MTIEEQKGNDEKGGIVSQQGETFCLAKLYGMKDTDDWEEIYVGLCAISKVNSDQRGILMIGIEGKEGEVLFLPIERTNKYESYDEVLILWKEVLCSYSLSFLSKKDRDYVLGRIHATQDEMIAEMEGDHSGNEPPLELPPVSVDTIHQICETVSAADISQKDSFHVLLKEDNFKFLHQLLDLFPVLESSNQIDRIHDLVTLCQLIMDLGYDDVVSVLFQDDCYLHLFGIMEYKPELPHKADYRDFFLHHVHFRNTMPHLDSSLESLMHRLYRLLYYRDAIDPQPIDEIISSGLTAQIRICENELLRRVCLSASFVPDILTGLEGDDEATQLSLCVVNELCLYCKSMTVGDRAVLMKALEQKDYRFSSHLHHCLHRPHSVINRSLIYTVLEQRVTFGLTSFRHYLQGCCTETILSDVLHDVWNDPSEIQYSCYAILTTLLTNDNTSSGFISFFYEHYAPELVKPMRTSTPNSSSFVTGVELVLTLLASNIQNHGTNLQFLILKYNLFPVILAFLESPSKRLHLICVQFLSSCLLSGVEWYSKYITKRDYISPLLRYAEAHIDEDNCVMSALLGCLRSIRVKGDKATWEFVKSKVEGCEHLKRKRFLLEDSCECKNKRVKTNTP